MPDNDELSRVCRGGSSLLAVHGTCQSYFLLVAEVRGVKFDSLRFSSVSERETLTSKKLRCGLSVRIVLISVSYLIYLMVHEFTEYRTFRGELFIQHLFSL